MRVTQGKRQGWGRECGSAGRPYPQRVKLEPQARRQIVLLCTPLLCPSSHFWLFSQIIIHGPESTAPYCEDGLRQVLCENQRWLPASSLQGAPAGQEGPAFLPATSILQRDDKSWVETESLLWEPGDTLLIAGQRGIEWCPSVICTKGTQHRPSWVT